MTYLSRQASNRFFRQGKVCWAVLFVLLAMLASCSKEVRQPLRIATNHWTGYKPFYLAQEIGHLPKESFQFFSLPNATGVLNAFRNGLVNVAALTLDEAILLKSQGVDIHIVAILDTSNGADVIMATPDIKSPADLKGKRIGMETGAVGAFMLSRMLEKAGLNMMDIDIIPLTIDQHVEAYKARTVDAVITFAPVSYQLKEMGAQTIFDSSEISHEIIDVLVVKDQLYRQNKKEIKALINGWFVSVDYIKQQPLESYRRLASMSEISLNDTQEIMSRIDLADLGENRRMLMGTQPGLMAPANAMLKVMLENELLVKPVIVDTLIPKDIAEIYQ